MKFNLYGTDILLNSEGNFMITQGGDLMLAEELTCLIQDVKNRLITYPGDLIYNTDYGVGVQEFIHMEDTELNRLHLTQKIKLRLAEEPRIEIDSIVPSIIQWKEGEIEVGVKFLPINSDNPVNIIVRANSNGIEVVK